MTIPLLFPFPLPHCLVTHPRQKPSKKKREEEGGRVTVSFFSRVCESAIGHHHYLCFVSLCVREMATLSPVCNPCFVVQTFISFGEKRPRCHRSMAPLWSPFSYSHRKTERQTQTQHQKCLLSSPPPHFPLLRFLSSLRLIS